MGVPARDTSFGGGGPQRVIHVALVASVNHPHVRFASESDRTAAQQRNDAQCHQRTSEARMAGILCGASETFRKCSHYYSYIRFQAPTSYAWSGKAFGPFSGTMNGKARLGSAAIRQKAVRRRTLASSVYSQRNLENSWAQTLRRCIRTRRSSA